MAAAIRERYYGDEATSLTAPDADPDPATQSPATRRAPAFGKSLTAWSLVALVLGLAAGILLELANVAHSWGHGVRAGHDPWGGATLEWFALSPPPEHNFDVIPDVRSAEPLDDIRRAIRERTEGWPPATPPLVTGPSAREPKPAQATGGDDPGSQDPSGGASVA